MKKKCTKCLKSKFIVNFSTNKNSKDGYAYECKQCQNKKNKAYYKANREKVIASSKQYYASNRDKIKKYYSSVRPRRATYMKKWRKENKTQIKSYKSCYEKHRKSTDPSYKLLCNMRSRILLAVKSAKYKSDKTMNLVGCSISDLRKHIESKFERGMNWSNYGRKGWHVDHIIPCSSFNLLEESEQRECFHYTNLQPLWWYDNVRKSNKLNYSKSSRA